MLLIEFNSISNMGCHQLRHASARDYKVCIESVEFTMKAKLPKTLDQAISSKFSKCSQNQLNIGKLLPPKTLHSF